MVHERMSQGKGVKCIKVNGWSTAEMKGKQSSSLEQDTEEMENMERYESGRYEPMLEEFCLVEWKRKSWTSTRSRTAKKEVFEVGIAPLEWRRECRSKQYKIRKVERRLLAKSLRFVQRVQLAASAEQAGGVNGRRRDEAAAKNGYHERSHKENQIKRKNGR